MSIVMDWDRSFPKDKPAPLRNVNVCEQCQHDGTPHEVIDVPDAPTTSSSCWGDGVPTHKRRCTGCGYEDGPWVYADHVGGGW